MAHTDPFDILTPLNTEAVSNGDDRIRELKRALDERFVDLFEGWPVSDPLKILYNAMLTSIGFVGVASATPQVLFGVPLGIEAVYEVSMMLVGKPLIHTVSAMVASNSAGGTLVVYGMVVPAGGLSTITVSGGNIRGTHSEGTACTMTATLRRVL